MAANDVLYPGGVTLSDAEHTALQSLGQHPENGIAKPTQDEIVPQIQAATATIAETTDDRTDAEKDADTESPAAWDGVGERRVGTDRRVIDAEYDGEDRRIAESDRRAEPPAKTEVDETVTEQPEQPQATSVGEPEGSVTESPLVFDEGADTASDAHSVEDVLPTQTGASSEAANTPGAPQPGAVAGSEQTPDDENLNPVLPADKGLAEPTVPGTPPGLAAHGAVAAEPGGENEQPPATGNQESPQNDAPTPLA